MQEKCCPLRASLLLLWLLLLLLSWWLLLLRRIGGPLTLTKSMKVIDYLACLCSSW